MVKYKRSSNKQQLYSLLKWDHLAYKSQLNNYIVFSGPWTVTRQVDIIEQYSLGHWVIVYEAGCLSSQWSSNTNKYQCIYKFIADME